MDRRGDSLLKRSSKEKWRERKQEEDQRQVDDAGLDDSGWLWKTDRRGPTRRGVAKSYVRTCLLGREPEERGK